MCGIVGYIGAKEAQNILIEGLRKLEYRGYDSAGIAIYNGESIGVQKTQGRLCNVEKLLEASPLPGQVGIGHTRWATHGKPSDENAHPHQDNEGRFAIVHNGIIENYIELKEQLIEKGHTFLSETDSEVVVKLMADLWDGDLFSTVKKTISKIRGAYALGIASEYEPDKIIAVRNACPLIVGFGEGENFIASDIPAILEHTRKVYILKDGEMAVLTNNHIDVFQLDGTTVEPEITTVEWDLAQAEKAGYAHFMLKEIHEQPKAITDTLSGRIEEGKVDLSQEISLSSTELKRIDRIHFVACGTAFHAGMVGKYVVEELTRIPVEIDIASEYRYRNPIITDRTLVIVVSQSGETADTLAALREAKKHGARVIAITNVVGSSVAREADDVLVTWAGPEIAVASTKAYTSQLIAIYLLGIYFAQVLESTRSNDLQELALHLQKLPAKVQEALEQEKRIQKLSKSIGTHKNLFFLGRGLDYAVALEGSLKLKEISYIHSEAYAAGELKHGTLALIEEDIPVISLATQKAVFEKMISNIQEVKARGGRIIGLTTEGNTELQKSADELIYIPETMDMLAPVLAVIPLQLLSYYVCMELGFDVDKPRNLAKSVTVE